MSKDNYIIHSAALKLKHEKGSEAEALFLEKTWDMLSVIPGVIDFRLTKIINDSSPYDFEIEMKFENQEIFDAYNKHPNHWDKENNKGFVPEVWMKEVDSFLEKDTVIIRK